MLVFILRREQSTSVFIMIRNFENVNTNEGIYFKQGSQNCQNCYMIVINHINIFMYLTLYYIDVRDTCNKILKY